MSSTKSDSISQDVEHERKSKRKQDQISDGKDHQNLKMILLKMNKKKMGKMGPGPNLI